MRPFGSRQRTILWTEGGSGGFSEGPNGPSLQALPAHRVSARAGAQKLWHLPSLVTLDKLSIQPYIRASTPTTPPRHARPPTPHNPPPPYFAPPAPLPLLTTHP